MNFIVVRKFNEQHKIVEIGMINLESSLIIIIKGNILSLKPLLFVHFTLFSESKDVQFMSYWMCSKF